MKSPTPALMLQGTSSNAGKSILTAAFCRILLQDGYRVAPFKAQNMALNSHVTADGLELGRAQAVQAAACRLDVDVRMNPVLLKPNSDTGSQVVVMGRPVGNMRVREYMAYKPVAFDAARAAYDSLAADVDVMVLEGAGSPAEVNLKAHDIVNMAMARHAEAKVLLVGDIDRGGVFASLVGTMELLDPWERDLVAGFVLNKFRGDATLLSPAYDVVTGRTGKPFLGVVPWLHDLGLPDEDSVSFRETLAGRAPDVPAGGGMLDIVLVDLPHISNFTDLDALRREPDVAVRVVRSPEQLGSPDAIILPGSKNTLGDRGITQKRAFFAFVPQLDEGEEGRIAWRFFTSPEDQVTALLRFTGDDLGITSYAALYPDEAYGRRMAQLFADKVAQHGGSVQRSTSYPPSRPEEWNAVAASFVGARKVNDYPVPSATFRAVFLPDGWKHMEALVPNLFYHGEDRQVLLGTALWEQGLAGQKKVDVHNFGLAVFPGAWNPTTPTSAGMALADALRQAGLEEPDAWVGLGYDFVRLASRLGVQDGWTPASVNAALTRGQAMSWSIAPMHWSTDGRASQDLFLFTPTETGFEPVAPGTFKERYERVRERHDQRARAAAAPRQ